MDHFTDKGNLLGRGSSKNNDDGVGETKWEEESDSLVIRKKRPPSTFDQETFHNRKKQSPENYRVNDERHAYSQAQVFHTSNNIESASAFSGLEPRHSNYEVEYNNEKEVSSIGNCIGGGREKMRSAHSSDSNKNADTYEMEEELEDLEDEIVINGTDNTHNNNYWKEFVDSVDTKSAPNLDAYIKAKAVRNETSTRFVNAMDNLIQSLRDATEAVLSEVVGPICSSYSESFNYTEEDIIATMVSNHSRRKEFLEIVHNADVAWANKCNELTAAIMGESQPDQKCVSDGDIPEDRNEKSADVLNSRPFSKGMFSNQKESKSNVEKTIFGHNDSGWEELLEHEPSRERTLSFQDERDKRNQVMRAFEESLHDIHSGLQSEVEGILQIASDIFDQHEAVALDSENEIENYVMENYERRSNLQKELEQSELHALDFFLNLRNRLSPSVS